MVEACNGVVRTKLSAWIGSSDFDENLAKMAMAHPLNPNAVWTLTERAGIQGQNDEWLTRVAGCLKELSAIAEEEGHRGGRQVRVRESGIALLRVDFVCWVLYISRLRAAPKMMRKRFNSTLFSSPILDTTMPKAPRAKPTVRHMPAPEKARVPVASWRATCNALSKTSVDEIRSELMLAVEVPASYFVDPADGSIRSKEVICSLLTRELESFAEMLTTFEWKRFALAMVPTAIDLAGILGYIPPHATLLASGTYWASMALAAGVTAMDVAKQIRKGREVLDTLKINNQSSEMAFPKPKEAGLLTIRRNASKLDENAVRLRVISWMLEKELAPMAWHLFDASGQPRDVAGMLSAAQAALDATHNTRENFGFPLVLPAVVRSSHYLWNLLQNPESFPREHVTEAIAEIPEAVTVAAAPVVEKVVNAIAEQAAHAGNAVGLIPRVNAIPPVNAIPRVNAPTTNWVDMHTIHSPLVKALEGLRCLRGDENGTMSVPQHMAEAIQFANVSLANATQESNQTFQQVTEGIKVEEGVQFAMQMVPAAQQNGTLSDLTELIADYRIGMFPLWSFIVLLLLFVVLYAFYDKLGLPNAARDEIRRTRNEMQRLREIEEEEMDRFQSMQDAYEKQLSDLQTRIQHVPSTPPQVFDNLIKDLGETTLALVAEAGTTDVIAMRGAGDAALMAKQQSISSSIEKIHSELLRQGAQYRDGYVVLFNEMQRLRTMRRREVAEFMTSYEAYHATFLATVLALKDRYGRFRLTTVPSRNFMQRNFDSDAIATMEREIQSIHAAVQKRMFDCGFSVNDVSGNAEALKDALDAIPSAGIDEAVARLRNRMLERVKIDFVHHMTGGFRKLTENGNITAESALADSRLLLKIIMEQFESIVRSSAATTIPSEVEMWAGLHRNDTNLLLSARKFLSKLYHLNEDTLVRSPNTPYVYSHCGAPGERMVDVNKDFDYDTLPRYRLIDLQHIFERVVAFRKAAMIISQHLGTADENHEIPISMHERCLRQINSALERKRANSPKKPTALEVSDGLWEEPPPSSTTTDSAPTPPPRSKQRPKKRTKKRVNRVELWESDSEDDDEGGGCNLITSMPPRKILSKRTVEEAVESSDEEAVAPPKKISLSRPPPSPRFRNTTAAATRVTKKPVSKPRNFEMDPPSPVKSDDESENSGSDGTDNEDEEGPVSSLFWALVAKNSDGAVCLSTYDSKDDAMKALLSVEFQTRSNFADPLTRPYTYSVNSFFSASDFSKTDAVDSAQLQSVDAVKLADVPGKIWSAWSTEEEDSELRKSKASFKGRCAGL
ncbi:hypothetical protein DFJ74DRAFT_641979 [Hyaloraphidium curvatum]|nr:hypothetical protein DFJ74DRAFT_641979 [Hyaloraphidium curvatum]